MSRSQSLKIPVRSALSLLMHCYSIWLLMTVKKKRRSPNKKLIKSSVTTFPLVIIFFSDKKFVFLVSVSITLYIKKTEILKQRNDYRHGESWYNFRSKVQKVMLQPQTARMYVNSIEEASTAFLKRYVHEMIFQMLLVYLTFHSFTLSLFFPIPFV